MGLAQKRIVQEFQTTEFPTWKQQFDTIVGYDMPMEIKWDTMQAEDRTDKAQYFEYYKQVYFNPLMNAFKSLCSDSMGKEAVKGAVKKIVIDGSDGIYASSSKFDGGTFTVLHKFDSNTHKEDERTKEWQKMIEAKL